MKREFLTELGLESEQVDKIMAEHGKSVNSLKDEKDQAEQKAQEVDDLKQQIQDRDKQLDDLSKKAKGNDDLEQQIEDLKDQNEKTQQDYEQKLEQQKKDFAIESALRDENVHDPALAKNALDVESITFKDGKVYGLDEQVSDLKENKAFLFKQDDNPGLHGRQPQPPSNHQTVDKSENPFTKEGFNMTKQGQLVKNEPEKAKGLIQQAGLEPAKYNL